MQSDGSILWLVAEDSEDDFLLLQRACSDLNPSPTLQRANNGVEAQQYLAGEGLFNNREVYPLPSVVVSDLNMPLMDGLGLLVWFKGQPCTQGIPFVLLTNSNDQSDRERARERGADDYFTKPGRFGELVETVAGISEWH